MQLRLPIFPREARLINDNLGVYEKDDIVQYIVNGAPVYSHTKDDLKAFRFITSNFIHQGTCRKVDIQNFFGVSEDSVSRYYKKYVEQGEEGVRESAIRYAVSICSCCHLFWPGVC